MTSQPLDTSGLGSRARAIRSLLIGAGAGLLGLGQLAAPSAAQPVTRATDPGLVAAYSLIAPSTVASSGLIARAVIPRGAPCPRLQVTTDHKRRIRMTVREPGATALIAFASVTVCEVAIPKGASAAAISGRTIPAAIPRIVDSIALFSDTGCRIRGSSTQNCANPNEWPLAPISAQIAKARPDVILNMGDFIYRESACSTAAQGVCGGSPPPITGLPFLDSDNIWLADVFTPMAPMLPVAPLVMLRGNHETCDRSGNGYFLFFDPWPNSAATCAPTQSGTTLTAAAASAAPSWATTLRLGGKRTLRLAFVDSANGSDIAVTSWSPIQRATYEAAESMTLPRSGRESWLMTHKPIFGHVSNTFAATSPPGWTPWTSLDQTAASVGLLGNYSMILSSHEHLAQAVQIPDQPGNLILGNGGTMLDPSTGYETPQFGPLADAAGNPVAPGLTPYPKPTMDWTSVNFGYAIAHPGKSAGSWTFDILSPTNAAVGGCTLNTTAGLSCS